MTARFLLTSVDHRAVEHLVAETGCTETLAWILARRGITDADWVRSMLDEAPAAQPVPGDAFHDPLLLGQMAAAVERIRYAIEHHEPIAVYGDYDADGVCATVVATETLESLGADVRAYLPNRFRDGYGLSIEAVERVARDGARVLLTVDNGIAASEAVAHAVDLGLEVIICDHHLPGSDLPDAIIASAYPSEYPFPQICATVVVGKLAEALGCPPDPRRYELEAVATVADCMPLIDENRAIVMRGLAALRSTERPGLRALLSACEVHPRSADEETIGFRLAPRLNAAGRLDDPDRAYELLRAATPEIAARAARKVHELNEERRRIEREIAGEAIQQVDDLIAAEGALPAGLVVWGEGWHEGVVGIVASRVAERFYRPTVVIGGNGSLWRGSARSIPNVDLHAALAQCADLLTRWGGHAAAAGVTLDPAQLPTLRSRFAQAVIDQIGPEDLTPCERPDAIVSEADLTPRLVEELRILAPFGEANPKPQLLITAAQLVGATRVGADGSHLKCTLVIGKRRVPAIAFGQADEHASLAAQDLVDAVVVPTMNRFRGAETLQLEVQRVMPLSRSAPHGEPMCQTACDISCPDRTRLAAILGATIADVHDTPPADRQTFAARPLAGEIPMEPVLACDTTRDLRHTGVGSTHVARLVTAGANVLVLVADVARRRSLLAGELAPNRLGATPVLLSDRCTDASARSRLRMAAAARARGECLLVMSDYAGVAQSAGLLNQLVDVVVVLDPPATARGRDVLLRLAAPLHLTFGAAEQRLTHELAAQRISDRSVLGGVWRGLVKPLHAAADELEALLSDADGYLPSPPDVRAAAARLAARDLLALTDDGRICRGTPR